MNPEHSMKIRKPRGCDEREDCETVLLGLGTKQKPARHILAKYRHISIHHTPRLPQKYLYVATPRRKEHLNNELLWKIHIFSQENKIYIRNNTMFYNISFIFFVDAFIFYIFFVLYYVSNVNVNYEFQKITVLIHSVNNSSLH